MTPLMKKVVCACRERTLGLKLRNWLRRNLDYISCLKYLVRDPYKGEFTLHCPEYRMPSKDAADVKLVERIFSAYLRMKEHESSVSNLYRPSLLWREQLELAYGNLVAGFKNNDFKAFHFFLENFGTWKNYTGIEHSSLIWSHINSSAKRLYLKHKVFLTQLKLWNWFFANQKPLARLSYPQVGNQAGAFIQGNFVGLSSFFSDIHGSLLAGLINDYSRPVLGELGGGYGKLAYFILRDFPRFTYVDFDLPETLSVAAYYLMKVFPEKRTVLYGERAYNPFLHKEFDLIFMPPWEIEKLGSNSIDLFINKNSLGEMSREAVCNYIHYITSATRYFFHMNHDNFRNHYESGQTGLLSSEYPVSEKEFVLLFRYPDLGHLLSCGYPDLQNDIFIYLYKKKKEAE